MSFENRTSFQLDWQSDDVADNGERETTVWRHRLMNGGAITVVHRLTGYGYGVWDTETGYRSPCGKFWLASGDWDIREHLHRFDSEEAMISWIIERSNNCRGEQNGRYPHSGYEWLMRREAWRPTP